MQRFWRIMGWLAPLALLLLLVTTNVRLAANSLPLYTALFERHGVPERSGITMDGLHSVGQQVQDYFNNDTEPLVVVAEVDGVSRPLFNEAEVSHMADVKVLFLRTYRVQEFSALFLLTVGALAWYKLRRSAMREYARWFRRAGVLTFAIIGALALGSVVAFDALFTLFHYIGFPQGNWTFDPRTDYLVNVFPFGFWQDITLVIGGATLLMAAALFGLGWWLQRRLAKAGTFPPRQGRTPFRNARRS